VQKLAKGHIENLKALQQKDLSVVFVNTRLLEDRNSQWYGFTPARIDRRLRWFHDNLLPILNSDLTKMEHLLNEFSEFWDTETGARISDTGKLHITNMHKVWRAIELSLENKDSEGPYRVEGITECKSHLNKLEAEIQSMEYRIAETWHTPKWINELVRKWFERNSSAYSLELPANEEVQPRNSILHGNTPIPLGDSHNRDLEKCCLKDRNDDRGQFSLLRKELWLVTVCLVAAVVYSILAHDVQTGFTIAGVLLASGNVLLAAIACKERRTRKIALE
jgi:hypothetical protein